jgi:glyoxylase-like metal-dependent hydrolase (beta-lactamase superfamily II)
MITTDVVPGVHRVTRASTNLYVIADGDAVTIIDAGLPGMWDETTQLLRTVGRGWGDVAAIVLTHGHFDHVGILARALAEHRIPVWAHPGDHRIVRHPYRYRPGRPRLMYPLLHPRSVPHLAGMVAAGALRVRGVDVSSALVDGAVLDVPGRPSVVATPGHTDGHCALHLQNRDVVFTGDALVTLDPYTGRTGPRLVGQGGTHDVSTAEASLARIAATGAAVVAPGHGELWKGGVAEAVRAARAVSVP